MSTVMVTGANRGIGLEFVRQYADQGWEVIACCRDPLSAKVLIETVDQYNDQVHIEGLDLGDHAGIDALAAKYKGKPIDVLINNAATVQPRDPNMEQIYRQKFGTLDYEAWGEVFRINTMGAAKVAESFIENLEAGQQKKIISISSSMGSIEMKLTPVYLYNSSKAALNKVVSMMAIDLEARGILSVAFCPGHVQTDLGGPTAAVTVAESVGGMRSLIAKMTMKDTGTYTRYNGEAVPW